MKVIARSYRSALIVEHCLIDYRSIVHAYNLPLCLVILACEYGCLW